MGHHRIGKGGSQYKGKRGAGILFTDGKQVLLLKRAEGTGNAGTWGLPGGKVEKGETTIAGAIRETKEETGITEVPGNRLEIYESRDGTHRWTTYLYRVREPFEVTVSEEHTDYKWEDLDKIGDLNLHPKFKGQWERYRRGIARKLFREFREWFEFRSNMPLQESRQIQE